MKKIEFDLITSIQGEEHPGFPDLLNVDPDIIDDDLQCLNDIHHMTYNEYQLINHNIGNLYEKV